MPRDPYRVRTIRVVCALVAFAAVSPAGDAGALPAGASARPVSLAADDFDGDGVRDLACGYATAGAGFVTISRGNAAAVYGPGSLSADAAPPFFAAERRVALPVAPNMLAAGDFDNDGRRDVVAGALGGNTLYLLAGDGRGGLVGTIALALPGRLTALASGDVNRIDGLADIVAGVDGAAGSRLLVFEGPEGAARATPEVVATPAPVAAVAVGQFDDDAPVDVAAAAGSDLVVVHGRNRPLVAGEEGAKLAPPPAVEVRAAGAPVGAATLDALAKRTSPAVSLGDRAVTASLAMRLNADAVDDYVVLEAGHDAPSFVLSQPAATFTVTTTADDGPGSLRVAIALANASPGTDLIDFNISGSGVHTIQPVTPLPEIVDPVTIDATSQPGFSGTPLIEIDGSLVTEDAFGLRVFAGSSVVRGLIVNGFPKTADDDGIGILLEDGGGNIVEGNFLGVDASGTSDRKNGTKNVQIYESAGNLIGGRTAAARNVIAGSCELVGIAIDFSELASDNRVEGNYIGTDVTGTVDLNSRSGGVFLGGGPNCVVGGTAPGARNVISGNGGDFNGFDVGLQEVGNNLVQGNYIGTDAAGTGRVSTSQSGAVLIDGKATDNTVGGTAAGAANRIAFDTYGVDVGEFLGDSTGNAILGNEIFGHEDLGIGLGYDEVTPNDRSDGDAGSNNFQNFPVLTSAAQNGDTITIEGRLTSTPSRSFRVEFFGNTSCNTFGFGEGEGYLGFANVATDASGIATFVATVPTGIWADKSITATATDASGNTSEFSMCIELQLSWDAPDQNASDPFPPPRNLTAEVLTTGTPPGSVGQELLAQPRTDPVTAYNVYRSNQPGVQPSPATFFTSVPPTQTAANASVFAGGTFFVVTAVYPTGESGPSNEVETGTPPTIASVKVKGSKVTGKGSGFTTDSVLVTVDGIPFRSPAVVKGGGAKVIQRGVLITGESIADYARTRPGRAVTVLFRNSDGGIDGRRVTVPGA